MELSEDQIIEKDGKNCRHCNRNMLLPKEYEWSCFGCGYNVIKRKPELSKTQRKTTNFINRLKDAELKKFCICIGVYKVYENLVYRNLYEVLSVLKNEKLKIDKTLIEKNKDMLECYSWFRSRYMVWNSWSYL